MKKNIFNLKILLAVASGIFLLVVLISFINTPVIRWKIGDKQMYNINMQIDSRNYSLISKTAKNSLHEIKGILNLIVYDINDKRITTGFQFSRLEVLESKKRNLDLEQLYSTPFIIEFSKNGEIVNYQFPNELAIEDETLILGIIKGFQVIIPTIKISDWNMVESDMTGKYSAHYQIVDGSIIKKKKQYNDLNSIAETGIKDLSVIIKSSGTSFLLSKESSWLEAASIDEIVLIKDKKFNSFTIKCGIYGSLNKVQYDPDNELFIWKNNDADLIKTAFAKGYKNQVPYIEKRIVSFLKEKYKNENLGNILNSFTDKLDFKTANKLAEFLHAYPDETLKIKNYIIANQHKDFKVTNIIFALSRTNFYFTQKALLDIVHNNNINSKLREYTIISMRNFVNPTEELIRSLIFIADTRENASSIELSNTALLALGTLSDKSKINNKDNSERIKNELLVRLNKNNSDVEKTSIMLKAISNISDESLIPVFQEYSDSSNSTIRAISLSAFASMNDAKSMSILLDHMNNEKDSYVKNIIVDTLIKREPNKDSIAEVSKLVQTEADISIRYKMIQYIVDNRKNYPGVNNTLQDCLKKDFTDKEIALVYKGLYSKNFK